MSDAFYSGLRDTTAGPLIEKYGMAVTLRRVTKGTYDANTDTTAADTTVDYPCYVVVDEYNVYMKTSGLVAAKDKKLLVSAKGLPVTPQIGDQFIGMADGTWYIPGDGNDKNAPVQPLAPGGIPVLYTVQVRQ